MSDIKAKLLGKLLLESKVLSLQQLQDCLEEQERVRRDGGVPLRFGELLVKNGYIEAERLEEVLKKQRINTYNSDTGSRIAVQQEKFIRKSDEDFSKFEIVSQLGTDAFGISYEARHTESNAHVLLRIQKATEMALNSELYDYFYKHARQAKHLSHVNLQRVLAVGNVGKQIYYAAEFIEGVSLRRIMLEEKRLPWPWVVQIALQLVLALKHFEENNFVHGDINLSNILIDNAGNVKLGGYGVLQNPLANIEKLLENNYNIDVPFYVSPEQILNENLVDIRSDIYSLGATMYHLISGQPPYSGNSIAEVVLSITRDKPDDVSSLINNLPPFLNDIVMQMMEVDCSRRYQNVENLEADLRNFIENTYVREDLTKQYSDSIAKYHNRFLHKSECITEFTKKTVNGFSNIKETILTLKRNCIPIFMLVIVGFFTSWYYRISQRYRMFVTRAESFERKGDLVKAIAALKKGLTEKPNDKFILERIASLGEWSQDFSTAEMATKQLIASDPVPDRKKIEKLGDIYSWQKKFGLAANAYNKAEGVNFEAGLQMKLGQVLRWGGQFLKSADTFYSIYAQDNGREDALLEAARSYYYGSDFLHSNKLFAQYLSVTSSNSSVLIEYGDSLVASGDFTEAILIYKQYVKEHNGTMAEVALAKSILWAGKYDEAEPLFRKLLENENGNVEHLRNLAYSLIGQNKYHEAIEICEQLYAIAPQSPSISEDLAKLYMGVKRYDDAIKIYEGLAKRFPGQNRYLLAIAHSYSWSGRHDKAIEFYRKALLLSGDRPVRIELAKSLIWAKRIDEAESVLVSVGDLSDESFVVDVIDAYIAAGQKNKAKALLGKIRAKTNSNNLLTLAEMEIKSAQSDDKIELYEKWLVDNPSDTVAIFRLARLMRASGRHKEAWPLYKKLLHKYDTDEGFLLEASEEAAWSGNPDQELVLLEKVYSLKRNNFTKSTNNHE